MAENYAYPAWDLVRINKQIDVPIHEQIYRQMQKAIASNELSRGSRLPASRQLGNELRVSRNTVTLVYERLASEGYIYRKVGSGTFVEEQLPEDFQAPFYDGEIASKAPDLRLSKRGLKLSKLSVIRENTYGFELSPLLPAMDSFPFDAFKDLFRNYWHDLHAADLVYGEPGGYESLREQISIYIGDTRGIRCDPEQVVVCSSALQSVSMAIMMLLDSGDKIIMEDPGDTVERALLTALGLIPVYMRCDHDGLDMRDPSPAAREARMMIVSPIGQYPFGSNMGFERQQAILDWAKVNDAWVIEVDSNSEYRWSGQPTPRLAAAGRSDHTIYVSSFNRILGPGFRVAYMVVPHRLIESITLAQHIAGLQVSIPVQHVVAKFMDSGMLAHHLRRHRVIYRDRAQALIDALQSELGDILNIPSIDTGLQLTVTPKGSFDDVAISDEALKHGIDVPPLSPYCALEPKLQGLQIGFSDTPVLRIQSAIRTLRKVIYQVQAKGT